MSNKSDLSLLTVSSGVDPNYLNIGHHRSNKLCRETSPILQRYLCADYRNG